MVASLVTTRGKVMKRPPSSGQVFGIGSFVTSFSKRMRWQAPRLRLFGARLRASFSRAKPFHGLLRIAPISGFISRTNLSPISVLCFACNALCVLEWLPKRFIARGIGLISPLGNLGFSKITAFPLPLTNLSAIAPASNSTSTVSEIRSNSPLLSRSSIQRERVCQATMPLRGMIHQPYLCLRVLQGPPTHGWHHGDL